MEETKEFKEYKLRREEKLKSVKSGENVFHLSYFGGMISQNDLIEYGRSIADVGSEFSSYDKNGDIYNVLDSYNLDSFLVLSQITVQGIITNSINSATWDSIKHIITRIWKTVRNKEITQYSSNELKKNPVSFGLKVPLDKDTHIDFKLSGQFSEETTLKSLDKMLEFIESQNPHSDFKHPYSFEYNKKNGKWKKIDVDKE